jgi:hypothetical protein
MSGDGQQPPGECAGRRCTHLALDDTGGDGEVPMPGDHLRMLTQAKSIVEPAPDQTATTRSPPPDGVLF